MKRIRVSGLDRFDDTNINCEKCNKPITIKGDPQTPIYYKNGVFHYCGHCASSLKGAIT